MFNCFKKYLLIALFLVLTPSIYAIIGYHIGKQTKNERNKKFETLKDFLDSTNIDQETKNSIIEHFNKPEAGIPIWLKAQPTSTSNSISKTSKLFDSLFSKKPVKFPRELQVNEAATARALELRSHTKINPETHIPIFTKNSKLSLKDISEGTFYFGYHPCDKAYLKEHPYITLDSALSKFLPQTIPFRLAHEYAHIEIGNSTARKLTSVGIASALLCYIFLLYKNYNQLTSIASSLASSLLSVFLSKGYFHQQEEKACDLRAIELIRSTKGIEEFFSYKPETVIVFANNDWIIVDVKIKPNEAQDYTTWKERLFSLHPSNAERLRYCKAFAQEQDYPSKPYFREKT